MTENMSHRISQQGNIRHTTDRRQGMTQNLYTLIDEHIAWQIDQSQREHEHDRERPSSSGTLIVDWDGMGDPKVTWRNEKDEGVETPERESTAPPKSNSKPKSRQHANRPGRHDSVLSKSRPTTEHPSARLRPQPRPSAGQGLGITHYPGRVSPPDPILQFPAPVYVAGYAPSAHISHSHNDHSVHVRRHATRPAPQHSAFSSTNAAATSLAKPPLLRVATQYKADEFVKNTRDQVRNFVQKMVWKWKGTGLVKRFREETRWWKGEKKRSWVEAGYVT